jgi:protein-disulfide isomerase-like protein with CxxC motif
VNQIVAWHFSDPACPWAYSSRPATARVRWRFGDQLDWRLVMIGLSETTDRYEQAGYTPARMATGHRKFQQRFGMPFGSGVKSRLAPSSRACRAVIAAREESMELGYAALRAIQLMQFTTPGLLDDDEHLREALEQVDGLDAAANVARIDDPAIVKIYEEDDKARTRSAEGRPTHVQNRHSSSDGPVRYTAPTVIFETDDRWIEVGGFQPFESYDNALANLDPTLERRPTPERAADAVLAYPIGLTTAEVASIMRPSDLEDADQHGTERELIAAVETGELVMQPMGTDALWLPASAVASGNEPDAVSAAA